MKKTGQLLKEKRETAKLSISEVALATKINPKILTAIEMGEEKNLPAKTFLKGFLRSYALYLKMDAEEVLRLYQEETGALTPVVPVRVEEAKSSPTAASGRRRMNDENASGLRTAAVVVIVLLIGVIIGVRELIEKYQREKVLENAQIKVSPLEQPPAVPEVKPADTAVAAPSSGAQEAKATAGVVAPGSDVVPPSETEVKPAANEVNVSPSAVAAPAASPLPAPVQQATSPAPAQTQVPAPVHTPPVAPPSPLIVSPAAVAPVATTKPAVVSPPPPPAAEPVAKKAEPPAKSDEPSSPVKNIKAEIILEALDKVEVKFQLKGETKKLSLAPTQVHTIRADQPITFDFSDGGAVNIILNGRERGPAGELGKPKQIKIP